MKTEPITILLCDEPVPVIPPPSYHFTVENDGGGVILAYYRLGKPQFHVRMTTDQAILLGFALKNVAKT